MSRIAPTASLALLCALLGPGCAAPPAPAERAEPPPALGEREFDHAAEELVTKLREHVAARGWPDHVALAGEPPRPRVRLATTSRAKEPIDLAAFEARLRAALTDSGLVDPTAGPGDDDDGALALDASIVSETTDLQDARRADYTINLLLTEPARGGVLVSTRSRFARFQDKPRAGE